MRPAFQDGTAREIRLKGGARFRELIVVDEPAERYAARGKETHVPGAHALLAEWRLTATDDGARLQGS